MAEKKKSANRKNTVGRQGSSGKAAISRQGKPAAAVRNRRWGAVFILIGIFACLGYFKMDDSNGLVIKALCGLFKGLSGWGFCIAPPLFVLAGILLLRRPERKRAMMHAVAMLAIPFVFGGFVQVLAGQTEMPETELFKTLWRTGVELQSGGIISGFLTYNSVKLLTVAGTIILQAIVLVALCLFVTGKEITNKISISEQDYEVNREKRSQAMEVRKQEAAIKREEIRLEAARKREEQQQEKARIAEEKAKAEEAEKKRRQEEEARLAEERAKLAEEERQRKIREEAARKRAEYMQRPYDQMKDKAPGELPGANTEDVQKETGYFNGVPGVPNPAVLKGRQDAEKESEGVRLAREKARIKSAGFHPVPEEKTEEEEEPVYSGPEFVPDDGSPTKPVFIPAEEEPVPEQKESEIPAERESVPDGQKKRVAVKVIAAENEQETIPEPEKEDAAPEDEGWRFPPLELLEYPREATSDSGEEAGINAGRLEEAFRSFGHNLRVVNTIHGPNVTRYEAEIEAGTKLSRLVNLEDDIALALGAAGVRIAAVPSKISTVGIEVPNKKVSTVWLREIIESEAFTSAKSKLTFAIGKNVAGEAMVGNISKLPHLLIAGTTGSGKSVCLNSLILSILYKASPDEVKFIMIDPKMVEFNVYNGIPHMLIPVVTDAKKASGSLQYAVVQMEKRYRLFADAGVRELDSYNARMKEQENGEILPRLVVIIDELADLMMTAAKDVENSIVRVAQMGRAAGVHLVIATQSPRADVITGLMKANIPSRIAMKVSSALESRIILDSGGGADKLIGNGDMLYAPIGTSKPLRVQGTWVSDEEREAVVNYLKLGGGAEYDDAAIKEIESLSADKTKGRDSTEAEESDGESDYDELLPQAVDVVLDSGQASTSMLQRRLKLGYSRAARIVDQMEQIGVIGPFEGSKPRQLLITRQQWQEMQMIHGTAPQETVYISDPEAPDEFITNNEE